MPRILICTVGGQPQPIVTAVRQNAPLDLVVFLGSTGRPRAASAPTIRWPTTRQVRGHCPYCGRDYVTSERVRSVAGMAGLEDGRFVVEGVEDPDDLSQVLEACDRIAERIAARWPRCGVRVLANYTGGTKTMSLGLGLFALSRAGAGWVLQLNRVGAGGRSDLVRVRAGDHPVLQDPSQVLARMTVDLASALLAGHDASGGGLVLSRTLADGRLGREDQQRLLALSLRCRLQAARDRCRYREALELARMDRTLEEVFAPRLSVLVEIVSALASAEPWPDPGLTGLELVDDLRENAERCAARERYDDAIARMHRATHLLAQLRLRRLHGFGAPVRASGPALRESAGKTAAASGLWASYLRLEALGDGLGRYFSAQRSALRALLAERRVSLFGEGSEPMDREKWSVVGSRWHAWLDGAQEIL